MKKLALTIAIILGVAMTSFANPDGGGLFQYGSTTEQSGSGNRDGGGALNLPGLPGSHGETTDQGAPLGSGIAVLVGLGAAYLVGKKHKEE